MLGRERSRPLVVAGEDCEVQPVDNIAKGIWLTDELLTPDECRKLVALGHERGYRPARLQAHGRHNHETFLWLY